MQDTPKSKDCTHGYKGMRLKLGTTEYTTCPLCEIATYEMAAKQTDSHKLGFCVRYACGETCVGCGDSENGLTAGVPNR